MTAEFEYPDFVTFEAGARLLVTTGIDPNATAGSVRHVARTRSNWPFGDGEEHPHQYVRQANARAMRTSVLLAYFKENPPNPARRGPDKKPRAKPNGAP
ncbi:hypothetical protein [Streptomyces sp. NPDC058657]|uniref:hypothetical protein n=1 Tax=unclassified Streptomyces TaxID=2593676 RepID=UPI0036527D4F